MTPAPASTDLTPDDETTALEFLVARAAQRKSNWLSSKSHGELLSYAAGIIDGEGCLGVSRHKSRSLGDPYYVIQLIVSMTVLPPVQLLLNLFGGNIRLSAPFKPGWKAQYRWVLQERELLLNCLAKLDGKTLVKSDHIKLGILYLQSFRYREKANSSKEKFYLKFKELNK